jgi:hypothetical protein
MTMGEWVTALIERVGVFYFMCLALAACFVAAAPM